MIKTLTRWISKTDERERVIANARRIARPTAARHIARVIGQSLRLTQETVPTIPAT